MALTRLQNVILKGALSEFHQVMETADEVWRKHCMLTKSTSDKETYAFPGVIPTPRVFEDARSIQGFRDFKFDVENITYELTILVDREDLADDQTGNVQGRFRELGEVFSTYKDEIFAALLENGGTGLAPWDAAAFYGDSRTIGDSGTIDNNLTGAIVAAASPTSAEFLAALKTCKKSIRSFNDDQGRPFNSRAVKTLRAVCCKDQESAAMEALNASYIAQTENVFKGMAELDILDYIAGTDTFFVNAIGSHRKPFIMQEREPLEVIVDTDPTNVAERNGVLVMCRERFVMTYGDPRRSIKYVFTTA